MLLDEAIVGCKGDEVEEFRSLGDTLERWRTEILIHTTAPERRTIRPMVSTCARRRSGGPDVGSPASSTTACASSFMSAV